MCVWVTSPPEGLLCAGAKHITFTQTSQQPYKSGTFIIMSILEPES